MLILNPKPLPANLQSDALAVELYELCLAEWNDPRFLGDDAGEFWEQSIMDKFPVITHIEPVGALFGWV